MTEFYRKYNFKFIAKLKVFAPVGPLYAKNSGLCLAVFIFSQAIC